MGGIIKHEPNEIYVNDKSKFVIPSKLPISKKVREVFLSTWNFPKIKMIADKDVVSKKIQVYLNQTLMDKGVNIEKEDALYLTQRVVSDIIQYFPTYTLEEVRLAMYYGVRGEFGKYYGINPVAIDEWLRKYRSELLTRCTEEIQLFLPKPKVKERPQREVDEGMANTLCEVYFKYVTEGVYDFYDIGNVGYKLLDRLGLIKFTVDEKITMLKESRIAFEKKLERRNREIETKDRTIHKLNMSRALEQLEHQSNPTFEFQVKVGAMRIAIYKFMTQLAAEEVDLKELIDEKMSQITYDDEK